MRAMEVSNNAYGRTTRMFRLTLLAYSLLAVFQSLFVVTMLTREPSESGSQLLFGLSGERFFLVLVALLPFVVGGSFAPLSLRTGDRKDDCYVGLLSEKIGSSSDMAMPPTTTPITVIMIGSIRLVAVLIDVSTSLS